MWIRLWTDEDSSSLLSHFLALGQRQFPNGASPTGQFSALHPAPGVTTLLCPPVGPAAEA